MAHLVWQTLPIWLISRTASSPTVITEPTGSASRSMPTVVMFSAKSPAPTSSPFATMVSMDSCASSETWRCQSPAWASPSNPRSSISVPETPGVLRMVLRSERFTDTTVPCMVSDMVSLLLAGPQAGRAAGLRKQPQLTDLHAAVDGLAHIIQGQRGHSGRRERLHLDARLAVGLGRGGDPDASGLGLEVHPRIHPRQRV